MEGFTFSCRVSLGEQYRQRAKSRATNKPVCFVHVSVLTPFPLMKFVISWVFFSLPSFLTCSLKAFDTCLLNSQLPLASLEESPPGFLISLFLVSILSLLTLSILHELRKFAITGEDGLAKIKLNEHKKAPNLLLSKL